MLCSTFQFSGEETFAQGLTVTASVEAQKTNVIVDEDIATVIFATQEKAKVTKVFVEFLLELLTNDGVLDRVVRETATKHTSPRTLETAMGAPLVANCSQVVRNQVWFEPLGQSEKKRIAGTRASREPCGSKRKSLLLKKLCTS